MLDSMANPHAVFNVPPPLEQYNVYGADRALREAVAREGGSRADAALHAFGRFCGRADTIALGTLANENPPTLSTHDRYGHRVDLVRYHPAYHELMRIALAEGLHASPWDDAQSAAQVARAAKYFLQTQVEAGHGCPVTMTFACVPTLRKQPDLAAEWLPRVLSREYDPANAPAATKRGATIGMAMTEKQGGSDVRANTTRAERVIDGRYALTGHKFFVSAPMCDAFLVLAQAPGGLSCFLLPRWLPDGTKNALELQQLKQKMGNRSNASSETELRGATAWLVGDEGRGVANIIEMVALTRFDCLIGSSAGMRQAAAQALHHCHHRAAFGALLDRQPLMQNVLADLVLESEAATALTLRVARALDESVDSEHARLLVRLATAVGKSWICKRAPGHAYEALECIGGSGVMETTIMPRLYREAPVNAVWEGSGNIQCLDVLRALRTTPEVLDALFAELATEQGADPRFDALAARLRAEIDDDRALEYRSRSVIGLIAVALQAAVLLRGDATVAEAFLRGRVASDAPFHYGTLPQGVDCAALIERGRPEV